MLKGVKIIKLMNYAFFFAFLALKNVFRLSEKTHFYKILKNMENTCKIFIKYPIKYFIMKTH